MRKVIIAAAGVLIVPLLALGVSVVSADSVLAQTLNDGLTQTQGTGSAASADPAAIVKLVVNWLLWFVGIISVIMLIWGGIRYATSAGDSNKVTSAKNTILYAIIGLVVAIFAWAIVNWVITTATV